MTPVLTDPRLIVGLDLPSLDAARAMVDRLGATIRFYKIGLTLLARPGGVAFAHELQASGRMVFQDWKLHDIGAQVEGAARAVAEGGCDLLTVHAEPQVMRGAVKGRDAGRRGCVRPCGVCHALVLTPSRGGASRACAWPSRASAPRSSGRRAGRPSPRPSAAQRPCRSPPT